MTPSEPQVEIERLRSKLAEAHAAIADRDAKIEKLAADVATLQAAIKTLMQARRGKRSIPEGQGVLFPECALAGETPTTEVTTEGEDAEGDDDSGDEDDDSRPAPSNNSGKKRTPGKIDTFGLPREERVHDVPQDQRIDSVTGKPLVQIGEQVFEELEYKRPQLIGNCSVYPTRGWVAQ